MVALFDTAGRVDLELERFESTPAGDGLSLLRVDGRWLLSPGVDAPVPALVAQRGARRDRFEPLPGTPLGYLETDARLWTVGFAVPLDIVLDARVRYWLHAGDDARYPLPAPTDGEPLDDHRTTVVVRNGRPQLLIAAGLMAAALAPLAGPSTAAAQEPAPPATTTPETQPAAPTDPAAATTTAPDQTTPAPSDTPPPAVAPAPAAAPAPATAAPTAPAVPTPPPAPESHLDGGAIAVEVESRAPHHHADKRSAKKHKPKHSPPHSAPPKPAEPKTAHAKPAAPAAPPKPAPRPQPPVVHAAPAKQATATPHVTAVPSPLQQTFAVPPFLLPIYQAASVQYDVPWRVLAAINQVETDYGRNLNVSSAGAQGWMQFMPSTWNTFGVDANLDGRRDSSNPADAIFAAARYLRDAGAPHDLRAAIFAYNHAGWYVDTVLAKARALARVPTGAIAALTGLALGRFPVPGSHVTYTRAAEGWVSAGGADHTLARVTGPAGRDVVAPTTVRVLFLGHSRNGAFAVLEDAYGNRFTYGHLGHLARHYAQVRARHAPAAEVAHELRLDRGEVHVKRVAYHAAPALAKTTWPTAKERLYAHPGRPGQVHLDATPPSVIAAAARRMGVKPADVVMARLQPGAVIPAGTVIGRLGGALTTSDGRAHVAVRIKPAGRRSHHIDPAPLLEAWRLAARGAIGPTSAKAPRGRTLGLGRTLLLDDHQLGRAVLLDRRVHLTRAERDDIRSGSIDRRVLTSLEALADAGLNPSVSALRSGDASDPARALGRGLEIAALNGKALSAGRTRTSDASRALRLLRSLPGALAPRHARLAAADGTGTPAGPTAFAASTSTSTAPGRLTVAFPRHPHSSPAVSHAVDALLSGAPFVAGVQGAAAPELKDAPQAVKDIAAGADAIAGLPYVWGGGHGSWESSGYDCSGSVSYALHAAGLLDAPLTSGELTSWGEAGAGQWVTIYANPTHVIMEIGGQFYGTSGFGHPETGGGPGWFSVIPSSDYLAGFTVRHPAGL